MQLLDLTTSIASRHPRTRLAERMSHFFNKHRPFMAHPATATLGASLEIHWSFKGASAIPYLL
jgi:hypothetical protein